MPTLNPTTSHHVATTGTHCSTGAYTIAEAEGVSRGTKIIIQLLEGQEHFAKKQTIDSTRYTPFLPRVRWCGEYIDACASRVGRDATMPSD